MHDLSEELTGRVSMLGAWCLLGSELKSGVHDLHVVV